MYIHSLCHSFFIHSSRSLYTRLTFSRWVFSMALVRLEKQCKTTHECLYPSPCILSCSKLSLSCSHEISPLRMPIIHFAYQVLLYLQFDIHEAFQNPILPSRSLYQKRQRNHQIHRILKCHALIKLKLYSINQQHQEHDIIYRYYQHHIYHTRLLRL